MLASMSVKLVDDGPEPVPELELEREIVFLSLGIRQSQTSLC